ncbi:endogenous retrovirus group K member 5 Gag polyprotein-like [Corvus moneduloides]|uniref:endogenous retrovirus group K member 5 Gag polyprotein-like n=1 Tax=Corvus moneduloides TaxID=1196302 RepID=UPI0013628F36|nr:endogenous retrovirus group K member 5 Gag polyprotein-like [Corvus moneduloides]
MTHASWEPLSHQTVKELCKAQKEFGRESKYFRGLLQANLSGAVTTPFDLRQLFSCLLSSAEFLLWKLAWERELRRLLPVLLQGSDTAVDADNQALTMDHLSGEGEWALVPKQAQGLPLEVLQRVKELAGKAFLDLRPDAPVESYSRVRQQPTESFLRFVERLTRAVELQVRQPAAREEVIVEMAMANANPQCKAAILSLPLDPPPTIQAMLEVCAAKAPHLQPAGSDKQRPRGMASVRAATPRPAADQRRTTGQGVRPPSKNARRQPQQQTRNTCFLCNQPGHWTKDCPLKREFHQFKKEQGLGGLVNESQKN